MTDFELAQRAAAGDVAAFEQVYRTYDRLVRNIAKRFIRDRWLLEDAVGTVWVWLASDRWRLDPAATPPDGTLYNLVAMLARIAATKVRYRARALDAHTLAAAEDEPARVARTRDPDPETHLLQQEIRRQIDRAIAQLSPQYQLVARLRYFEELTCSEIAAVCGVKAATIPSYLHDIREKLRGALAGYVTVPPKGSRASRRGYQRNDDQRARYADRMKEQPT